MFDDLDVKKNPKKAPPLKPQQKQSPRAIVTKLHIPSKSACTIYAYCLKNLGFTLWSFFFYFVYVNINQKPFLSFFDYRNIDVK